MLGKIRIQQIRKLHQKKYRLQEKRFIAEGTKIVMEVIERGFPTECIIATPNWFKEFLPNEKNRVCFHAEKFELEKISCLHTTPDVLAVCELQEVQVQTPDLKRITLIVDAVRDPGNLGTIIRLADWFGVQQILATEDSVEWSNPKCIQASMGSFIRQRPVYLGEEELKVLCKANPGFAADLDGENLYTDSFTPGGLFVVSSESHGLSPVFQQNIKQKLTIPSAHPFGIGPESLNVATATGIFLSEFHRRMQVGRN